MGFISKTYDRLKNGEKRLEESKKGVIEVFFSNQDDVKSYQVVDENDWTVDVEGSVHIHKDDLTDGELPFKIGKLTGNLYSHVKNFKPSIIPSDMGGEVIFAFDEGERMRNSASGSSNEEELGMGYLSATPKSYTKVLNALEDALTECIKNGYDIDIDAIKEKIQKEWADKDKYKLVITFEEIKNKYYGLTKDTGLYDCKIFIDDSGKELKLSAIEKAVYLTFMLYEDGIKPDYLTPKFYDRLRGIYTKLADTVKDTSDDSCGVMVKEFNTTTLNGYRSKIREAIKAHISNKSVVDLFAIEGYKDEPYKVERATDEIRDLIKSTFGVN